MPIQYGNDLKPIQEQPKKYGFYADGKQIAAANYNSKGFYDLFDIQGRLVKQIPSQQLKLPKENSKSWDKLIELFGDK